jgi:hypothetical protein
MNRLEIPSWNELPEDARAFAVMHTRRLMASLSYLMEDKNIEEALFQEPEELARWAYDNPRVILSHGTEEDPVLNYGNAQAQQLWEMPWNQLTRTPSRETAEPNHRLRRGVVLERVKREGYVWNYHGIRKTATGRRFRMKNARIWQILEKDGSPAGTAAMFRHWEFLK